MRPRVDRTGERHGRLTIIAFAGYAPDWRPRWKCVCDCGNTTVVQYGNLQSGQVKSCGCLKLEALVERSTKHGLSGGAKTPTRLYRIWLNMRRRCLSPRDKAFAYYGGRGIRICPEWDDFAAFHGWALANGYRPGLTIERKDVSGDYCPENCTWVPFEKQARNRRTSRRITYKGETRTLAEWAEHLSLPYGALRQRLHRGWPIDRAFETPVKRAKGVV